MTHRSHNTQLLLNYLDETDVRSRETPWTIEGQLMNAAACVLEESELRLSREVRSSQLGRVPLNLDNGGVWHQVQVPYGVPAVTTVQGVKDGKTTTLKLYDDIFPIPTGVEYDSRREVAPMSSPSLYSVSGDGNPHSSGPLSLPIPNRLYFWIEGLESAAVDLYIEGHPHPRAFWASSVDVVTEKITVLKEGPAETTHTWESIQDITVRGLPVGASVKVAILPAGFSYQPDEMRPYTDPAYRDVTFPSYWSVEGRLLTESFFNQRFYGIQTKQTYFTKTPATSVTVEPNTHGLLVTAGSEIHYCDRREPVPSGLARTSLTEEPLYGLQVLYDRLQPGDQRFISLTPIPYANSDKLVQYRYWVEAPNGSHWTITKNGDLTAWASNFGWVRGTPSEVTLSLPNSQCGTWMFVMECSDQTGHRTFDKAPYLHAELTPLASFDTSQLAPQLAAAVYDSRERLWIWTGDLLVPVMFRYDAYLYDESGRTLYLTDSYDELRLS